MMPNIQSSAQWIKDWANFQLKVWRECSRYILNLSQPKRTNIMSKPHEFFEAMAEAKAAMDKLPEIEGQLASVHKVCNRQMEQIAELQDAITKANQLNMELQDKVRSLEVERDDAGFRQLEAEDRLQTLLGAISVAHGQMGEAVKAASPVAPEPSTDRVCEEMVSKGVDTIHSDGTIYEWKTPQPVHLEGLKHEIHETIIDPVTEPTSQGEPAQDWASPPNPIMPTGEEIKDAVEAPFTMEPQPQSKPFFGWNSFDKPMSTSWQDFLAGGGTRPSWLTDEEVERDAVARAQSNDTMRPVYDNVF